jgi:hypothetical protein
MRPRPTTLPTFLASALVALAPVTLAACHANPESDQTTVASSTPAAAAPQGAAPPTVGPGLKPRPPHPPVTHVMTFADHLRVVELDTGDFIESPNGPDDNDYDWSSKWKGPTVFEPADGAPPGHLRFRATKSGGANLILDGDPKCMKVDANCTIAKRQWTLFYVVH